MQPGDKIIVIKDNPPFFQKGETGTITLVNLYTDIIHFTMEEYKGEATYAEFKEYFQILETKKIECPVVLKNWMRATYPYLKAKND
jgi:hypothetical protein